MGSIKFLTIVYFLCGLFFPLWPVSLPAFWYLAYKSYKS